MAGRVDAVETNAMRRPASPSRAGRRRRPSGAAPTRHLKILRVGALIVDGRRELCLIRNISAGGLMAHVYSQLMPPASAVTVELKSNQPVAGRVVWVREANAGIQFDAPIDVEEMLANPPVLDNGWRPRTPRVEVDRMATLRCGARTYWVHARDISQSGVKIETDQPLEPGSEVVLTLEDFRPLAGVVRWSSDGHLRHRLQPADPVPRADRLAEARRLTRQAARSARHGPVMASVRPGS